MQDIRFTCTTLPRGKSGALPPDKDGYYTQPVGGLNCFNSAKQYYPLDAARAIFEGSSTFMRRVTTGCLKGELGHPKPALGEDPGSETFLRRVMSVDERNTCVHFKEIWLDLNSMKDDLGRPIVAVMAKFKPSGAKADALERSLNNNGENTCFSVRAFTNDHRVGGVLHRDLVEIITYDHVTEPGIDVARKFRSSALEDYHEPEELVGSILTRDTLSKIIAPTEGLAMESGEVIANALFRKLGWDVSHLSTPKFLNW